MAECIVVDVINSTCNNNSNNNNNNNTNNNCTAMCEEQQNSDLNNQLVLSVNVVSDTRKVVNKHNLNNFFLFKDKMMSGVVSNVVNNEHVGSDDKTATVQHQQQAAIAMEDQESVCSEEDNCRKKRRCTDRYDSSESSDSGVAVHCADCGSSNSDITEPCSPLSTTSLDEMPPTAVGRSTASPASVVRRPPPAPSPVGDTNTVQWPWTDPPNKRPKQGKITEYFRAKGGNKSCVLTTATVGAAPNKDSTVLQPWVTSPVSKFLSASVKSGVTLTSSSGEVVIDGGGREGGEDFEEEEEDESNNRRSVMAAVQEVCSAAPIRTSASATVTSIEKGTSPPPAAMVTSTTSTIVTADNAEENSSSGASDVSSLFTGTTSSSRATDSSDASNRQHRQQQQPQPQQEQERTIRFPVKNGWRGHYVSDVVCRWTDCEAKFTTSTALLEHLQINHVNSQTLSENYVCRWSDCKVYERKSCSRTWLERHVLSHGGNKPYRCIVDGCGHRFSSQTLLQRHVNNHFSERDQKGDSKKGCETANKLIRRNGKKLRYRRQPFSARIYDYFDAGIMEGLQHKLIELTERRTQGQFDHVAGDSVLLQSRILGRRTDEKGETQVLLRWFPCNVINDEWVRVDEVTRTKNVPIRRLPIQAKDTLYQYLLNENRRPDTPQLLLDRRWRRKQCKNISVDDDCRYIGGATCSNSNNNNSVCSSSINSNSCSPASSSSSLTDDHLSSSPSSSPTSTSSSSPTSTSTSSRETLPSSVSLPSSVPLPSKSTTTVLSMRTT